jgi:hypothetical protein
MSVPANIRAVRELIAALDRRQPQSHRRGEAVIAEDSAVLRRQALARLAELEREWELRAQPPPAGVARA